MSNNNSYRSEFGIEKSATRMMKNGKIGTTEGLVGV